MENRRFFRIKPTGRDTSAGKIVVDMKSPAIDCVVVDTSAGGACLEVNPGTVTPKRFELVYGGMRKKCRVAWVHGRRIGVAF